MSINGANQQVLPLAPLARLVQPVVHKAADFDPSEREVCLLVGYAPDGRPSPALLQLAGAFASMEIDVHVCLAVDDPAAEIDILPLDMASAVYARQNGGYDFAVWASVLDAVPALWRARRLFFVNDSILIGRPDAFVRLVEHVQSDPSDFIALTESNTPLHHTQSYFFVVQAKGLTDPAIREFWSGVRVEASKTATIEKYELTLFRQACATGSLRSSVLFSFDRLFAGAKSAKPFRGNPTHLLWERLLECGFPFIKAELLHRNPFGLPLQHWRILAEKYGADLPAIDRHLAELSRNRRAPDLPASKRLLRKLVGAARYDRVKAWNRQRLERRR